MRILVVCSILLLVTSVVVLDSDHNDATAGPPLAFPPGAPLPPLHEPVHVAVPELAAAAAVALPVFGAAGAAAAAALFTVPPPLPPLPPLPAVPPAPPFPPLQLLLSLSCPEQSSNLLTSGHVLQHLNSFLRHLFGS